MNYDKRVRIEFQNERFLNKLRQQAVAIIQTEYNQTIQKLKRKEEEKKQLKKKKNIQQPNVEVQVEVQPEVEAQPEVQIQLEVEEIKEAENKLENLQTETPILSPKPQINPITTFSSKISVDTKKKRILKKP